MGGTHALPVAVPTPLEAWTTPYAAMARNDQLVWPTLDAVLTATRGFPDPVLAGARDVIWDPAPWKWSAARADSAATHFPFVTLDARLDD